MGADPRRVGRMRPAVAVMAKTPGLGPVKSRLHPSLTQARATDLYRCFLLDRLDGLKALDGVEPVIAFTPPEGRPLLAAVAPPGFRLVAQRGRDLGERLSNLLSDLLSQGHKGAMAIDSDSPTLPMSYVLDAVRQLEMDASDIVLGPCEDGGYYLIGLSRPCPALFEGIPWSTDRVLGLTLDKARQQGLRTHLLPTWFDVDTEPDLRRLRAEMMAAGSGPRRTFAFVSQLFREAG
jgi:rSAM/selenodomain-associated transferase 1